MLEPAGQLAETYNHVILCIMIVATALDGLIDGAEKRVITREGDADAETAVQPATEYEKPATVKELTAAINNDEALAAETYLAARLVYADLSCREIVFLTRLLQALRLDDQLMENLEKQPDLAWWQVQKQKKAA